jgi:hypothetical protein
MILVKTLDSTERDWLPPHIDGRIVVPLDFTVRLVVRPDDLHPRSQRVLEFHDIRRFHTEDR